MGGHHTQKRVRRRDRLLLMLTGSLLVLTPTAPALAQTATAGFLDRLGELAGQAGDLLARAEATNAAWEGGEVGFSDTAGQLQEIETDAALFFAAVQEIAPPDGFTAATDQLAATASDISAGASAMVAGLRAADSGQARQAALDGFRDSVGTFQNLVAGIQTSATTTTTSTSTSTTTTTAVQAASTTVAEAATTTTIVIELGAPADPSADDGGAPWALVPIALMAGLAMGLIGGMILGAKTRRRLIDQLKALRGSADGLG